MNIEGKVFNKIRYCDCGGKPEVGVYYRGLKCDTCERHTLSQYNYLADHIREWNHGTKGSIIPDFEISEEEYREASGGDEGFPVFMFIFIVGGLALLAIKGCIGV